MSRLIVRGVFATIRGKATKGGLLMKSSSQPRPGRGSSAKRSRRSTRAVVLMSGLAVIMAVGLAGIGRAAPPKGKINRFASVASVPNSVPIGVTVDQVVSLKDVPVAQPMAIVIPAPLSNIPGPNTNVTFQSLTDCTTVAGGFEPPCLVKDQTALIALGKALFWDMQVGSDGVQACATCHFNAGADIRTTNQINPGQASEDFKHPLGGDSLFGNSTVPFTANDPVGIGFGVPPNDPPLLTTCTGDDPLVPWPCNVPGHPNFNPNITVAGGDFPLNDWDHPTQLVPRGTGVTVQQEFADVTRDTNDAVTSQGVRLTQFLHVNPGSAVDSGTPLPDIANTVTPGVPNLSGVVRRTEPRNAPTMINAVFNYDNLWDGKASFIFNGWDAFGFRNRTNTLKKNVNGTLTDVFIRVTNSSLASVAAAVPTSNITMSYQGRTMPDVGTKMLSLRPLAKQAVHPQDSVLGTLARGAKTGLTVGTYADMIKAAFQDQWWNSATPVGAYNQMQFNFSLFFGLAVQAYESTLISDDTPFDRFEGSLHPVRENNGNPIPSDPNALTNQQLLGLTLFMDDDPNVGTHCADCHVPPITTGHTVLDYQPDAQGVPSLAMGEAIEFMIMGDDQAEANYDHGMYNIGVRRTTDDKGRIATGGSTNPLTGKAFPFSLVELTALLDSHACDTATIPHVGCLPPDVARFVPNVPILPRRVTHGAFKAPNLRNIKFTGPYFHVGDSATLRQVVEFYARGGNFPNTNLHDKTVNIDGIPPFMNPDTDPTAEQNIRALVDFLAEGLKDSRVAFEKAPFDHPEIFVPNGAPPNNSSADVLIDIPAVGKNGRPQELPTFLNLDPQQSDTSNAGAQNASATGTSGTGNSGSGSAQAAASNSANPTGRDWNSNVPAGFAEAGYIQAAALDSAAANSGGTLTINGTTMIVPANSIIQFPANTLTWSQLFQQLVSSPVYDPAVPTQPNLTITPGTTGLALFDNPGRTQGLSPYVPFNAIVLGNIDVSNSTGRGVGAYIVGLILPIGQDLGNSGQGFITFIDYAKGRFEVGGTVGVPNTGTVVEINDPTGRYGYAHSPDPRWSVDPDNPTIASTNGYPMGIPKVAPPAIDPDRPVFNRPLNPAIGTAAHDTFLPPGAPLEVFSMPPSTQPGSTTPDPWKQAPFMVGDYVIYAGILCKNNPTAAINPTIPWNQQTYISANTVSATQLIISTAPGDAGTVGPAYMQLARGVVGVDGTAYTVPANPTLGILGGTIPPIDAKNNIVIVGFVTDPSQLVDIFAADIDPVTGLETDRLLGTTLPDPGIPGPGGLASGPVGRFKFDVLRGSFQPTTRVYVAQSRHGTVQLPPQVGTITPANGLLAGQYHSPMFTFVYLELVPGFPVIPNNFNLQPFLTLGEGGNLAPGPLSPFPPF